MFDFQSPLFLLLLAAIPLLVLIQGRTKVVASKWRKRTTFLLRCAALLCAILALANLQRTDREQRLAVSFLLDVSESVAPSQREDAIHQINTAIAQLKPNDQFGVISFASHPNVLIDMGPKHEQPSLTSDIEETITERDATDIVTSLKRSIELLSDNYHHRIVLFTDGIHNIGNNAMTDFLPLFSASGVEIMTVPLDTVKDAIRVLELKLPSQVRKEQRFPIQAIVETDGSILNVSATFYHNGVPISDLDFSLEKGKNVLTLPTQQVSEVRPHTYQLKLNVIDEILENNQAFGVVQVQDKSHILYVESDLDYADNLKDVLEDNGLVVNVISPAELPTELVTLQQNDALILSNVSTDSLSSGQINIIENYVRALGHGLVVIGGDHAFGPGGYTNTTLERILPVEMTPREQKETVALVFVIDTSGSMANYVGAQQKIELAVEAIRAGIRNLEEDDQAAVIGFDVNLREVSSLTTDHEALIRAVGKLVPTGGTTAMGNAISKAGEMLKTADAKRKHIILLSDGKSEGRQTDLIENAEAIAEARIGITTIAIGDAAKNVLEAIAIAGKGRFKHVQNIQELPKVLMNAVQETQNYIVQETFQPNIVNPETPILEGLNTLPMLYGYVATAEKTAAQVLISSHKHEPVLVGWYYGLGKTVAWTSDVKPAWSQEWISWDNFGRFWGQVVNWTLPPDGTDVDFDIIVSPQNGKAEVIIDTQQSSSATFTVKVAGPNRTSQSVNMQQESATRYLGSFLMNDSGSYIVTAQRDGDAQKISETLSLSYPAEYANFDVNHVSLKQLSEGTDGIYEPTTTQIVASAGEEFEKRVSLARVLLVVAVLLFVLEMILRRFSIMGGYLAELRRQTEAVVPETLTRLTQTKNEVATANPTIQPQVNTVPTNVFLEDMSETEQPRPADSAMSRLLAVKRKRRAM